MPTVHAPFAAFISSSKPSAQTYSLFLSSPNLRDSEKQVWKKSFEGTRPWCLVWPLLLWVHQPQWWLNNSMLPLLPQQMDTEGTVFPAGVTHFPWVWCLPPTKASPFSLPSRNQHMHAPSPQLLHLLILTSSILLILPPRFVPLSHSNPTLNLCLFWLFWPFSFSILMLVLYYVILVIWETLDGVVFELVLMMITLGKYAMHCHPITNHSVWSIC